MEIAARAVLAVAAVDPVQAGVYLDALKAELGATDGERLEETVMGRTQLPYRSDFGKRHYDAGVADGEARGEARAVLEVLRARGLTVSRAVEKRVLAGRDLEQIRRWVRRAVTVERASDLFDDDA